mgnify:CR=1 FL=1
MEEPGTESRDLGLLGRALVGGFLTATALFVALLAIGWEALAADTLVFSLSALPFALGLVGWSTVLLSGNAIEGFSREFGISDSWTAAGSRQAMALLTAFGAGGMIGSSVAATLAGL